MPAALHHPFSPQGMKDPYRSLAAFRQVSPAFFDQNMQMWLLTSHELCRAALRDPAFSAAAGQQQRLREDDLPISMLNTDGDLHQRLRTPATAPFSARSVGRLTDRLTELATGLLAELPGPDSGVTVDVVDRIGWPLAEQVLGVLLGLDESAWPELGALARAASANLNPTIRGEQATEAARASARLSDFLAAHSATRRASGAPDLAGLPQQADLDERERLGILLLTVVGGFEPLAIVLATTLHLLLARPAVLAQVQADQTLLPAAVDEALRMESPIPFTARVCVDGFTSSTGVALPAGAGVLALLSGANRDPAVFADPDTFDLQRTPNPHLALGGGPHFCLGAPLVRQATAIMLGRILTLRPAVQRAAGSSARWRPTLIPRGLAELPVTW